MFYFTMSVEFDFSWTAPHFHANFRDCIVVVFIFKLILSLLLTRYQSSIKRLICDSSHGYCTFRKAVAISLDPIDSREHWLDIFHMNDTENLFACQSDATVKITFIFESILIKLHVTSAIANVRPINSR